MRHPGKHLLKPALAAVLVFCAPDLLHAQQDSGRVVMQPSFALGTGMLGYFGDIGFHSKGYSPLITRLGFELTASAPVTSWLEVGLFALHGRVGANERSAVRNLNFESRITTGGVQFIYNFDQLLKPDRVVEPWVSIGIERVEFLSKTDLFDAQGREYNYWSDGSIRDIAENAPNAEDAAEITRDYSYESDIREENKDGFGNYTESSLGIPIGVGVKMHLSHGFNARIGTVFHFTGTDMIDGISDMSVGDRKGDGMTDRFLFTSFSVSYAIGMTKPVKKRFKPTLSPEQMDVIAYNEDEDGDGVMDWIDLCPHTPVGVSVDPMGCPLDGDGDGVPDFRDDELNTIAGAPVNERGVTLTDEDLLKAWLDYIDSSNVTTVTSRVESFGPIGKPKVVRAHTPATKAYVVKVGTQVEGISEELIQRILSLPDVRTIVEGDSTYYVVGKYSDLPEALKRSMDLKQIGLNGQVMLDEGGALHYLPNENDAQDEHAHEDTSILSDGVVIRVQLGAFRKPLSQNIFTGINDLMTIKGNDGLTRYYMGSFTNVNEAAKQKVDMLLRGFDGAFLVAFKDGKRVSIKETGAELIGPENLNTIPAGTINKDKLTFRVQVGTFVGNVPMETMNKYVEMGDVKPVVDQSTVRYLYGKYPTRAAAELAREELQDLGFKDAFVVGEFNGRIIQAVDAERLMNAK